MANLRTAARSTSALGSFAHLLGLPAAKRARRAEDEDMRAEDDERDKDEDTKEESDDKTGKKARKAKSDKERDDDGAEDDVDAYDDEGETDDDGQQGEEDDEDDDDRKARKGKKARKAKGEDSDRCDEEEAEDEDVRKAARAGRRFERARCKAIFAHPAAGVRPDMAAHLAFKTTLSGAVAIGLLREAANGRPGMTGRHARPRVDLADVPASTSASPAKNMAAQIIAAGKKRRGEK